MSTEPTMLMDVTGCNLHAKRYEGKWVYWPILCRTGAVHAQPNFQQVSALASCDFAPDYSALFDFRAALDAPEAIPSGSVKAADFAATEHARELTLLIGNVYRDGCRA